MDEHTEETWIKEFENALHQAYPLVDGTSRANKVAEGHYSIPFEGTGPSGELIEGYVDVRWEEEW